MPGFSVASVLEEPTSSLLLSRKGRVLAGLSSLLDPVTQNHELNTIYLVTIGSSLIQYIKGCNERISGTTTLSAVLN